MSTRDSPGGKGGRCVRLTTYHPCSAERQEIRGLNLPGPTWAISTACCGRDLYLTVFIVHFIVLCFKCSPHQLKRFDFRNRVSNLRCSQFMFFYYITKRILYNCVQPVLIVFSIILVYLSFSTFSVSNTSIYTLFSTASVV